MKQDQAEIIAIQALGWLAGEEDLLTVFLGSTGLDPKDLTAAAEDVGFLGSVLDFILLDDSHVTGFCDAANLPYDLPKTARFNLPGGSSLDWA